MPTTTPFAALLLALAFSALASHPSITHLPPLLRRLDVHPHTGERQKYTIAWFIPYEYQVGLTSGPFLLFDYWSSEAMLKPARHMCLLTSPAHHIMPASCRT